MLLRIVLHNWRSHAHSEINLSRGTNIFLGPMGSGKSSVVDALCFALYGTYPKLGRRDVRLEEVVNFRHTGQSVWVEVEWADDTIGASGNGGAGRRTFKVRRELDTGQAWLYADEKLLQKGPKAVSAEIEELLDIPYELFARAVYAEQNRLDYWLSLPSGTRKTELDRLLGLDSFEVARAGATAKLNLIKEQAAGLEAAAPAQRLEEARAQHQRRVEEEAKLGAQRGETVARRQMVDEQVLGAQRQYLDGEKTQRHLQALTEKKQKLLGSIAALEKTLKDLPDGLEMERAREWLTQAKAAREQAAGEAAMAGQAQAKAAGEAGGLEQKLNAEGDRAARAEKIRTQMTQLLEGRGVEQLRAELAAAQTRLGEQMGEAARVQGQLADAQKVLQALKVHAHMDGPSDGAGAAEGNGVSCPVCRQPLDEERLRDLRAEEETRIKQLGEASAERAAGLATLKIAHEKLMHREVEVGRLEAQLFALAPPAGLEELASMKERAGAVAADAKRAAGVAATRLASATATEHEAQGRVRQLEQAKTWGERLLDERRSLAEVEGEIGGISFSLPLWNDLLARREKLMREQAGLQEQEQSLQKLLESAAQLSEASRLVVADLEEKQKMAARKRLELDELGTFRTVLTGTQGQLRALLIAEINGALAMLWPLVYPYGDWTGVRLAAGEKDYAIEIRQGEWKGLEAHASGGERACLGLALRTSLAVLLTPQLGWLILDEPTHNLDAAAVAQLGRAMAEKLPKIIGQVIVITHEGQLLESTPGRVLRFGRDKEKGEDTQVGAE